jgi:type VI protein secretion system component Hcp
MALPTVIAANQTGSPVALTRMGLTVPASGTLTLTAYAYIHEIRSDESLYAAIVADEILLDFGQGVLSKGDSLKFFNIVTLESRIPVRALADADVASLSGTTTIDGVSLVAGDRVLLTAQSTASENGIWTIQAGAWTRPDDFATGQSAHGALIVVEEGTTYADQLWLCTSNDGSDVIDTNNLAFTQASGSSVPTLQQAYVAGNTITTSAGEGALTITTGAGAPIAFVLTGDDFTVNGANDVSFGGGTALSTFNLDTTGAITVDSSGAGISIDAAGASNLSTSSGDLTVEATAASLNLTGAEAAADAVRVNASNAAGGIDIDAGTAGIAIDTTGALSLDTTATAANLTQTANAAGTATLVIQSTNAGAGAANLDINVDDAITLDSASFSIDATTASNVSVTGAGLTLSTITSGTLSVTSAGALNLSGTTGDWQASGALTIDSSGGAIGIGTDADAQNINIGTGAAARTITLGNSTGATAISLDAGTGAINIGTNAVAHTVTVGTTTGAGSTVLQTGTGAMTFTAGGVFDVNATGLVTIDSTGGAINIGADANANAINIGTGAAARTVTIGNTTGASSMNIQAGSGNITLTAANTTVTGNLVVQGTTTSTSSETVTVSDNHLYLNAGYETTAAQTGGLVVNYLPINTTDTVATGGFTAGVAATSNPTVITTGSGTFAAGQFIQITGASAPGNNGLFEVLSHTGTTLTIRGIGTTATVENFTQNQFTTSTVVAGTITRVTVSVMRAGTDGVWESAAGSTSGLTFSDVASLSSITLQQAYVNGNTIDASTGEGNLIVQSTSGDADFLIGNGTSLTVTVDTTDAVSIQADAASTFNVTGAGLTLSTTTSGTLAVTSAGALNLSSTTGDWQASGALTLDSSGGAISIGGDADAQNINIGTGAAARTITVGNSTGATAISLNSGTGAINIGTNAVAHTVTVGTTTGSGSTVLQTGTGAMTFTAGGVFDVNATGAVTIDSSGAAISIGSDAVAQAINVGTGAAARTLTVGNNTGATAIIINSGTEQVQIDGVTHYGAGAGAPTARAGGFQDGDIYYDTNLHMDMRYDGSRSKWLSTESMTFAFGRNGNTAVGSYYFTNDSKVMSSTSGYRMPHNGTIVGMGYTRTDSDAATFDVVEGGTSRATLASSATAGGSTSLDGNFSANGILAVRNQAGGNITSDVVGWVKVKWRI